MWKIRNALIASILTIISATAWAGLFVCNNSAQTVNVAVGWNEDGTWVSRGWFLVASRECGALLLGPLSGRYYYYYAESRDGNVKWHDSNGAHFCTSNSVFYYNSDSDDCAGERFSKIDVGEDQQYSFTLGEVGDPTVAALRCAQSRGGGIDAFSRCWMNEVSTSKQRQILNCLENTKSKASLAICAAGASGQIDGEALRIATCANSYSESRRGDQFLGCVANVGLNAQQARAFQCAVNNQDLADAATCIAADNLTSEQRRIVSCVANNRSNYVQAGLCAAAGQLTPEQSRIAGCVLNNRGSYMQMGVCAAGSNLTSEQQVFANCAISTGGQPYAFAGCVGTQLTMNELQKCMTMGIGGSGCFGDNNTAVKFVQNAWSDVTKGPGPSNDLLGRDGWVGRKMQDAANDLRNGPGNTNDLVGKDGWVCQNLLGGC